MKILNSNNKNFDKNLDSLLLQRKKKVQSNSVSVSNIIKDVRKNGDKALVKYEKRFNKNTIIVPSQKQITNSIKSLDKKVKVADIKYLASNKVFLISIERTKIETDQEDKKINSVCRFDCVDKVKSKNIDQKNDDLALDLIAIDYLKNKDDYEINLIFDNNAYIALTTETIEVRLEDQNEIKE